MRFLRFIVKDTSKRERLTLISGIIGIALAICALVTGCSLEQSEDTPLNVIISGTTSDNVSFYNTSVDAGSQTDIDGILAGNITNVYQLSIPAGGLVGVTATQTIINKTITSPAINGAVTTTGLNLPAFTLDGHIQLNNKQIQGGGTIGNGNRIDLNGTFIVESPTTLGLRFTSNYEGAITNQIAFQTTGVAPGYADTSRIEIGGGAADTITNFYDTDVDFNDNYVQFEEMAAPGAGPVNSARVYSIVGGDTLTDLAAVFQDGTVDIFAQEATRADDARFKKASGTKGDLILYKPHPGLIQVIMLFKDGTKFVIKEIEYHDAELIAANKGCETNQLPEGWIVTTKAQRANKTDYETPRRGMFP